MLIDDDRLRAIFAEATKKAREESWEAGTPVFAMHEGRVVRLWPDGTITETGEKDMKEFSKKLRRGLTVIELVMGIWFLICFAVGCFVLYAAVHFILKFW